MSDKTGAPRPSRGGSGLLLSGLAVGAIVGSPVVAAAAVSAAGPVGAAIVRSHQAVASEAPVAAIREQFRASFTAGAVIPPVPEILAVICDPS